VDTTRRKGMTRRRRARIATAASVAIGLTAALAIGLAAAGLKTKYASATIGSQQVGSVTAKCKKGTKAISGGFDAELSTSVMEAPFMLPLESRKKGGRGWESRAANAGGGSGTLTSFAYCRDEKVKRRTDETTVGTADPQTGTATAKCPNGTKAIAGGFDGPEVSFTSDSPFIIPFESRRSSKREWRVSARNFGDFPGILTAQVICHEGDALKGADVSTTAKDDGFYDLVATCKRGNRAVSGGFDSTLSPQGEGGPWVITSHRQGKRRWAVSFFVSYFDSVSPATFTAYAYCEKK
jgi:hypothetical protein